jgi:hypothetical protein
MAIVQITEHVCFSECGDMPEEHKESNVLLIDMSKVDDYAKENDFEFMYIADIIKMVKAGKTPFDKSRKYSFSDAPEWYEAIFAPKGSAIDATFEYKVYI